MLSTEDLERIYQGIEAHLNREYVVEMVAVTIIGSEWMMDDEHNVM
jgi:hypothetical protein